MAMARRRHQCDYRRIVTALVLMREVKRQGGRETSSCAARAREQLRGNNVRRATKEPSYSREYGKRR